MSRPCSRSSGRGARASPGAAGTTRGFGRPVWNLYYFKKILLPLRVATRLAEKRKRRDFARITAGCRPDDATRQVKFPTNPPPLAGRIPACFAGDWRAIRPYAREFANFQTGQEAR